MNIKQSRERVQSEAALIMRTAEEVSENNLVVGENEATVRLCGNSFQYGAHHFGFQFKSELKSAVEDFLMFSYSEGVESGNKNCFCWKFLSGKSSSDPGIVEEWSYDNDPFFLRGLRNCFFVYYNNGDNRVWTEANCKTDETRTISREEMVETVCAFIEKQRNDG